MKQQKLQEPSVLISMEMTAPPQRAMKVVSAIKIISRKKPPAPTTTNATK
jgi:hypothetical protein